MWIQLKQYDGTIRTDMTAGTWNCNENSHSSINMCYICTALTDPRTVYYLMEQEAHQEMR